MRRLLAVSLLGLLAAAPARAWAGWGPPQVVASGGLVDVVALEATSDGTLSLVAGFGDHERSFVRGPRASAFISGRAARPSRAVRDRRTIVVRAGARRYVVHTALRTTEPPRLATGPSGRLVVSWREQRRSAGGRQIDGERLVVAVRRPGTSRFAEPRTLLPVLRSEANTDLAIGPDGRVLVAGLDAPFARGQVLVRELAPDGRTLAPIRAAGPARDRASVRVAAGPGGRDAVVFTSSDSGEEINTTTTVRLAVARGRGAFRGRLVDPGGPRTTAPGAPAVAYDRTGAAVAVWVGASRVPLDGDGPVGAVVVSPAAHEIPRPTRLGLGRRPSLALGGDGEAWAAWTSGGGPAGEAAPELRVARRPPHRPFGPPATLATAAATGAPRVAATPSGFTLAWTSRATLDGLDILFVADAPAG